MRSLVIFTLQPSLSLRKISSEATEEEHTYGLCNNCDVRKVKKQIWNISNFEIHGRCKEYEHSLCYTYIVFIVFWHVSIDRMHLISVWLKAMKTKKIYG